VARQRDAIEIGVRGAAIARRGDRHRDAVAYMQHDISRLVDRAEHLDGERHASGNVDDGALPERNVERRIALLNQVIERDRRNVATARRRDARVGIDARLDVVNAAGCRDGVEQAPLRAQLVPSGILDVAENGDFEHASLTTDTTTEGRCIYAERRRAMACAACVGESPPISSAPTSGRSIEPSSRTVTLCAIVGSSSIAIAISSAALDVISGVELEGRCGLALLIDLRESARRAPEKERREKKKR